MQGKLILLRHGQSLFNKENLFTGWTDIDLSDQGKDEAKRAGDMLKSHNLYPDICFTSWLKRAIHTLQIALKQMEWEQVSILTSWKLNERHYGTWQQHDKKAIENDVGKEAFIAVRRGYDTPPPPLKEGDPRLAQNDLKYKSVPKELLPKSESLKSTRKRALNYFYEMIVPELTRGKTVLVSAHGNSLRALVMAIENISPKDIIRLELPTGVPIVYNFDDTMQIVGKKILKDKS